MTDDDLTDGPADERCESCWRYVDLCRLDPCIPDDEEDYDR